MGSAEAPDRRTKRLYLVAALVHALAYFFVVGPWMGEDEPWHFEYASYVADGYLPVGGARTEPDDVRRWSTSAIQIRTNFRDLPYEVIDQRQREILASMAEHDYFARVDWAGAVRDRRDFDEVENFFTAGKQPPGYYALLGVWLALWPGDDLTGQLCWARSLSVVLYLLAAWGAWVFAHALFSDRWLALAAAVTIVWLPMNVRLGVIVTNDALARTLGALVFAACAVRLRTDGSPKVWLIAAALAVLGLMVKTTTVGLIGVLLFAFVLRVRAHGGKTLPRVLAIAAGAVVVLSSVAWVLYLRHSPALPKNVTAFLGRIESGLSPATLGDLGRTLAGTFNWSSRTLPGSHYLVLGAIGAVALLSTLVLLKRAAAGVSRTILLLSLVGIAIQLALIVMRGLGHGRYLAPVFPAIGAVLVVGLLAPWHRYWRPRIAVLYVLALVAYDALYLWGGLVPNEILVQGS
jgi:uncharacterized membrane protein